MNEQNKAPIAENDIYFVNQGESIAVSSFRDERNWLNNDADPDGDPLKITLVNDQPVGGFQQGTTVAGSNGGHFYVDNQGRWNFDDNRDFTDFEIAPNIETSVTYTVSDSQGNTDTATATVSITDDLVLWLDSQDINGDGSLVAEDTSISQWRDKSGNNNHAIAIASENQPIYRNDGVHFDGIDDFLDAGNIGYQLGEIAGTAGDGEDITIAVIAEADNQGNSDSLLGWLVTKGGDIDNLPFGLAYNYNLQEYRSIVNGTHLKETADSSPHIVSFVYDGAEHRLHLDGQLADISNYAVPIENDSNLTIGSNAENNDNRQFKGKIKEILVFDRELHFLELKEVEGYLAHKWNLTDVLPEDHVHKEDFLPDAELITIDGEGELQYLPDELDNVVPDFSQVGYRNSEVPIPTNIPIKITLSPQEGDDLAQIQNAINLVSAMPLDDNGFRGAILLKKGTYDISETIEINNSGVVLLGEGNDRNGTTITAMETMKDSVILFNGTGGKQTIAGSETPIIDDYVPIGTKTITIANPSNFQVGDEVLFQRRPNQAWIELLEADQLESAKPNARNWDPSFYTIDYIRNIEEINGDRITLDAPIVDPIDSRYATASLRKYTWSGKIENVAVENLTVEVTENSEGMPNDLLTGIEFKNTQHGWVNNITGKRFNFATIDLDRSSANISVLNSQSLEPRLDLAEGFLYPFNNGGQRNLFYRLYADGGRHSFVKDAVTPGPNVFAYVTAMNELSDSGPHQRWATGILWDNLVGDDLIAVRNRWVSGTGHGWAGAQNVLWNVKEPEIYVQDPPSSHLNWVFEPKGKVLNSAPFNKIEPIGYIQNLKQEELPESLFLEQLQNRIGGIPLHLRTFIGTVAAENFMGTDYNDRIRAAGGNDTLKGGKGNDTLNGAGGRDSLNGGTGNDRLNGGWGADTLDGGAGNDRLNMINGEDIGTGGMGKDTFIFGSASNVDKLVTDFEPAQDILFMRGFNDASQVLEFATQQDNDVLINLSPTENNVVRLQNVLLTDISESNIGTL